METQIKKEIVADKNQIAFCGLYCGSCKSFLAGKCQGCRNNVKATWCKLRACCIDKNYQSCADCDSIGYRDCKKCNNAMSKLFAFIFNSDRLGCLDRIKMVGYDSYAEEMAEKKMMTIKKKK
jgi:hypothetical protein